MFHIGLYTHVEWCSVQTVCAGLPHDALHAGIQVLAEMARTVPEILSDGECESPNQDISESVVHLIPPFLSEQKTSSLRPDYAKPHGGDCRKTGFLLQDDARGSFEICYIGLSCCLGP